MGTVRRCTRLHPQHKYLQPAHAHFTNIGADVSQSAEVERDSGEESEEDIHKIHAVRML